MRCGTVNWINVNLEGRIALPQDSKLLFLTLPSKTRRSLSSLTRAGQKQLSALGGSMQQFSFILCNAWLWQIFGWNSVINRPSGSLDLTYSHVTLELVMIGLHRTLFLDVLTCCLTKHHLHPYPGPAVQASLRSTTLRLDVTERAFSSTSTLPNFHSSAVCRSNRS